MNIKVKATMTAKITRADGTVEIIKAEMKEAKEGKK